MAAQWILFVFFPSCAALSFARKFWYERGEEDEKRATERGEPPRRRVWSLTASNARRGSTCTSGTPSSPRGSRRGRGRQLVAPARALFHAHAVLVRQDWISHATAPVVRSRRRRGGARGAAHVRVRDAHAGARRFTGRGIPRVRPGARDVRVGVRVFTSHPRRSCRAPSPGRGAVKGTRNPGEDWRTLIPTLRLPRRRRGRGRRGR